MSNSLKKPYFSVEQAVQATPQYEIYGAMVLNAIKAHHHNTSFIVSSEFGHFRTSMYNHMAKALIQTVEYSPERAYAESPYILSEDEIRYAFLTHDLGTSKHAAIAGAMAHGMIRAAYMGGTGHGKQPRIDALEQEEIQGLEEMEQIAAWVLNAPFEETALRYNPEQLRQLMMETPLESPAAIS